MDLFPLTRSAQTRFDCRVCGESGGFDTDPGRLAKRTVSNMEAQLENSSLKYDEELSYWKERYNKEGAKLGHAHYKQLMLSISGESEDFFSDKIVADFGCGPRGSLQWMTNAKMRIGIDVLVDQYMELGIANHNVTYVRSSETEIPLPTGYLSVIFTINSIDHVSDVDRM